jgi:hypothetical protein
MSLSISDQLVTGYNQVSEVLAALEELSKSDVEIKKISLGVERVENKLRG